MAQLERYAARTVKEERFHSARQQNDPGHDATTTSNESFERRFRSFSLVEERRIYSPVGPFSPTHTATGAVCSFVMVLPGWLSSNNDNIIIFFFLLITQRVGILQVCVWNLFLRKRLSSSLSGGCLVVFRGYARRWGEMIMIRAEGG